MGPIVLFTHLKINFATVFSVSAKISCIQMDNIIKQSTQDLNNREIPYCPSTSSSLNRRYSATLKWSTLSLKTLSRTYSQTLGLGRSAIATKGGRTIVYSFLQQWK